MSQTFAGKHVAVTGASRGIGAAIVNAFAQEGASLSLLSRNRAALESQSQKALASGASKAHVFEMDVGVQSSVSQAFSEAQEALGPVDVLVNNAGAVESRPLARTSQGLWNTMMAVNLNGVFYCIDAVLSAMLERASGRIVNIASTAGLTGCLLYTSPSPRDTA